MRAAGSEERVHSSFSFVSPLTNVSADFSDLHCAEENGELFIFCLSRSRVDSSEDVNHQHRVKKGGNDLACHRLYLASHCCLMSLKTGAQKGEF